MTAAPRLAAPKLKLAARQYIPPRAGERKGLRKNLHTSAAALSGEQSPVVCATPASDPKKKKSGVGESHNGLRAKKQKNSSSLVCSHASTSRTYVAPVHSPVDGNAKAVAWAGAGG